MRVLLASLAAAVICVAVAPAALLPHGGRVPAPPPPPAETPPPPPPTLGAPPSPTPSGGAAGGLQPAPASPGIAPATGAARPQRSGGPTGGSSALQVDFSGWEYWWLYNRDQFLGLREAVHRVVTTGSDEFYMGGARRRVAGTLAPSERDLGEIALPVFEGVLAGDDQRDVTTAALIGVAKLRSVGRRAARVALRARLRSPLRPVREAAVLGMGIGRDPVCLPWLAELALDSELGRTMCGTTQVDDRMRAFAAYALGLNGRAQVGLQGKRRAAEPLIALLERGDARWGVTLAAVHGLRTVDLAPASRSYQGAQLVDAALRALREYRSASRGRGERVIQAAATTAIAAMVRDDPARRERYRRVCVEDLRDPSTGAAPFARTAAVALADLATSADADAGRALRVYYEKGKDQQARYYSVISLGRIGGGENREFLLRALARANPATERPWIALALGLLARGAPGSGGVAEALRRELADTVSPSLRGALAVSLGLARDREAVEPLLALLRENASREPVAAPVSIALGLIGDRRALVLLREVAVRQVHRPRILIETSSALAMLGDKSIGPRLLDELERERPTLARLASVAVALGQVGDRRVLAGLARLASDAELGRLARGYAIVALGAVCDSALVPWQAPLSAGIDYRVVMPTLTDGSGGVLDIL